MARLQADVEGERIDLFLAKRLNLSRSKVAFLIKERKIKIDGRFIKPHYKTKTGERIEVTFPDETIKPENIPLDIVYDDSHIIVVNKPPFMITHATTRIRKGTLVNALLFHTSLPNIPSPERPGIVHRLDKDTSGLIVVAKTEAAYKSLVKMIKERIVKRKYLALVLGSVKEDYGEICIPIGRPKKGGVLMKPYGRKMREAKTFYKVLERRKDMSLLEVSLETGRTHQIRVHLASIGHPVIGDKSYGKNSAPRTPHSAFNRQALHAFSLSFPHPITNKPLSFVVEPPEDMHNLYMFSQLRK
ncbi:MAG: RluA family pseudouridine synthase [bacterium]